MEDPYGMTKLKVSFAILAIEINVRRFYTMLKIRNYILVTLVLSIGVSIGQELAQEKINKMMELAKPGPEHKMLEKMVGSWEQTVKLWMTPGAEPAEMKEKS
jgi:hypothetical protein